MKLTLGFMGLCLFVSRDATHLIYDVYLPDTQARKKHKDNSQAEPHEATLVILDPVQANVIEEIIPLDGIQIEFVNQGSLPAQSSGSGTSSAFGNVIDLTQFTTGLALDVNLIGNGNVAAVIRDVDAGSLSTIDETSGRTWTFGDELFPGHKYQPTNVSVVVISERDYPNGVLMRLRDLKGNTIGEYSLTADSLLCVLNTCESAEDVFDEVPKKPIPANKPFKDRDFRWYYNLLRSKPGQPSLESRIQGRWLPVPQSEGTGKSVLDGYSAKKAKKLPQSLFRAPDTPTCLCGFFCECPNHP